MSSARKYNTTILGRRNCSTCGRWRHISDFRARAWRDDGHIKYVGSECMPCHAGNSQRREQRLPRQKRDRRLEQMRVYYRERKRRLEQQRAAMPKIKAGKVGGYTFEDYRWQVDGALVISHLPPDIGGPVLDPMDASNECVHGRLPHDRTPDCGCWP